MKKVSLVLMIIILFNFIFCSFVYAEPNETNSSVSFNMSSFYQADQEGTVEIEGHTKEIGVTQSVVGAILDALMAPVTAVTEVVHSTLGIMSISGGLYHEDSEYGFNKTGVINVSAIVFGEILMLNPAITKTASNLNPSGSLEGLGKIIDTIKVTAAGLFEILRYVAMAILLVAILKEVLRISLTTTVDTFSINESSTSTSAKQIALFKGLLKAWGLGLIFVFGAKYLIVAMDTLLDIIMQAIWEMKLDLEARNFISFEYVIYNDLWQNIEEAGGMRSFAYGILNLLLSITTFKFFFKYLFRVFKILILVVTSPLVGAFHALVAASDGEEESKGKNPIGDWILSYLGILLIQPIHAIVYLVFMFTASEIAVNAPLLGIFFLWALGRAEKIVRAILGVSDKLYIVGK